MMELRLFVAEKKEILVSFSSFFAIHFVTISQWLGRVLKVILSVENTIENRPTNLALTWRENRK
jgi:hypothetical protein